MNLSQSTKTQKKDQVKITNKGSQNIDILLLSYSGINDNVSRFILDNGLAKLGYNLAKHQKTYKILDCNSAEIICNFEKLNYFKTQLISEFNKNKYNFLSIRRIIFKAFIEEFNQYLLNLIKEKISMYKPKYIGIKLWYGEGAIFWRNALKEIKNTFPKIKIIVGGPSSSELKDKIFDFIPEIDVLIYDNPEQNLIELLNSKKYEKHNSKNGALYNNNYTGPFINNDLNKSFYVFNNYDYSPINYLYKNGFYKVLVVDNEFPCYRSCHFCSHPIIKNKGDFSNTNSFIKLLDELAKKEKTNFFRLASSNTPINFLKDLTSIPRNYKYSCFLSIDYMNNNFFKENLSNLKEGGLVATFVGLEYLDKKVLTDYMNKPYNIEFALEIIKKLTDQGIFVTSSFIYPSPGAPKSEDSQMTYLNQLFNLNNISFLVNIPRLKPKTQWWNSPNKYGFRFLENDYLKYLLFEDENAIMESFDLNGLNINEIIKIRNTFSNKIIKKSNFFNISDEEFLIANASNKSVDLFKKYFMKDYLFLNFNNILDQIQLSNRQITKGHNE